MPFRGAAKSFGMKGARALHTDFTPRSLKQPSGSYVMNAVAKPGDNRHRGFGAWCRWRTGREMMVRIAWSRTCGVRANGRMTTSGVRRGSATLRPRARIVRTIGRDLISNETVALVELIKNSYDADASAVTIVFEEPLRPSEGGILLRDDGLGMTLDTVRKAWFEPATVSKRRKTSTPLGRRVTGEKGIGRFAAARLASTLEMTTLARGLGERSGYVLSGGRSTTKVSILMRFAYVGRKHRQGRRWHTAPRCISPA